MYLEAVRGKRSADHHQLEGNEVNACNYHSASIPSSVCRSTNITEPPFLTA
jgi:hypothetical protein